MTLVELCAGTASVSLHALGGFRPLTGYMGSKRRFAPGLVEAMGVRNPDKVVLCDAGPWGDVWTVLKTHHGRGAVVEAIRELDRIARAGGTTEAWKAALEVPSSHAGRRVARFLWLQARSAGTIPVWWSGERWESPTGSRTEAAHARGGGALATREKGRASRADGPAYEAGGVDRRRTARREAAAQQSGTYRSTRGGSASSKGSRGMQWPITIAERVLALDRLPWDRVLVVHNDVRCVGPGTGDVVYIDPPYAGCPRYAALLPRAEVLDLARRHHEAGSRVVVSEGEPLPLDGWTSRRLLGGRKVEWVTANWPIVVDEQLDLWSKAG